MRIIIVVISIILLVLLVTASSSAATFPTAAYYESDWIPVPAGFHITMYHSFGVMPSMLTMWCETEIGEAIPCEYYNECTILEHVDAELIHLWNSCDEFVTIRVDAVSFQMLKTNIPIVSR
jgi:hypothetical protein